MKHIITLFLAPAILLLANSCRTGSSLEQIDGVTVLHLYGSPYERGLAYGQIMGQEIQSTLSRWEKEVEAEFSCDPDSVIDEFFRTTTIAASMKDSSPDLLDEVEGMSEACGIPFSRLLAFQLSEEMFTILDENALNHCTAIGMARTDSTPTILSQNMDPPAFLHGHPFVMHIIPGNGEPENFILTVPGLLGMTGLNESGVAVNCLSISMLNHSTTGLPVVSVLRNLLSMQNLEEAEDFLKQTSFAIPQCYVLGDPQGVRCFECSANEVDEFYPFAEQNIVLHTNFSIANRDFNPGFIELLARYGKTVDDPYFCPRYFHAYDEIEKLNRMLSVESIEGILRLPEPDLEQILNENTLASLVMELGPDPKLNIAFGHNPETEFTTLSFR